MCLSILFAFHLFSLTSTFKQFYPHPQLMKNDIEYKHKT